MASTKPPLTNPPNTGQDWARVHSVLNTTGLAKKDPNLYQTINSLIKSAETFQGVVKDFYEPDANNNNLFSNIIKIINELQIRNNTKFGISLVNSVFQTVANNIETLLDFDTVVFDDGLIQTSITELTANANAQYLITGRVNFCTDEECYRYIYININGVLIQPFQIYCKKNLIYPYCGLVELLRNDIVTVSVKQDSGDTMQIQGAIEMTRTSYVNHPFDWTRVTNVG